MPPPSRRAPPRRRTARIVIDAAQVEGRIDARLYGQFLEFMYEGIKGGLSAELLRNRGFEEAPNAIGSPATGSATRTTATTTTG